MIANISAAVLFSMLTILALYICYIKFLIRKRSFREHYATWQTTQLDQKPQRNQMFSEAVRRQHFMTRREEEDQFERQSKDFERQSDDRQKQE